MADITTMLAKQTDEYNKFKAEKLAPAQAKAQDAAENILPDLPLGKFEPLPAPKAPEEISDNPMKLFASTGAALGTLLSFKARRPLVASMEALAAAGQAINKKDYDDYAKQMTIWKDQNKLALEQAQQQTKAFDAAFKANKGNYDAFKGQEAALVAAGVLDQRQFGTVLKGMNDVQTHSDRMASLMQRHEDASRGLEQRQASLVQRYMKDPLMAEAIAANPEVLKNPFALTALAAKTISDVSGRFGAEGMNTYRTEQTPEQQKKVLDSFARLKPSPDAVKEVSNNIRFRRDGSELLENVASDPEATGLMATIQQKIQPITAQLFTNAGTPEAKAAAIEKYNQLSDQALSQYVKDHPEKQDLGTRVAKMSKMLSRVSLEDAASIGRPTVFLERLTGSWYDPKQGADALIAIMYERVAKADTALKGYALDSSNLDPTVLKNKYRSYYNGEAAAKRRAQQVKKIMELNPGASREAANAAYDEHYGE